MTTKRPGLKTLAALTAGLLSAAALGGCSLMHDDLDPCPQGLDVRFIYDHNLSFHDRFADEVGGITVHVYTSDGRYVKSYEEYGAKLKSADYKMHLDLQPGEYRLIATGAHTSAAQLATLAGAKYAVDPNGGFDAFAITLGRDAAGAIVNEGSTLHPTYVSMSCPGATVKSVDEEELTQPQVTIPLSRIDNTLRLSIWQIDFPTAIRAQDFDIRIVDRNGTVYRDASLLPDEELTYTPCDQYTDTDLTEEGAVSRMWLHSTLSFNKILHTAGRAAEPNAGPALLITDHKTGITHRIANLADVLAQAREASPQTASLTPQEYLDRCQDFELELGIEGSVIKWIAVKVSVLGWSKRIQQQIIG